MSIHRCRKRARFLSTFLLGCGLPLLTPYSADAQSRADGESIIDAARVFYLEADYKTALQTLKEGPDPSTLPASVRAEYYELSAFCLLALDREVEARQELVRLFRLEPDYTLRQDWLTEPMRALSDEVRSDLRAEASRDAARMAADSTGSEADSLTAAAAAVDTPPEKGKSRTLYYVAGGVAAVVLISALLLAKDEDSQDTLTILPAAPGRP